MPLFNEQDAARIFDDSNELIQSLGTTRLLLRQPLPVTSGLDPDFKTPIAGPESLPFLERPIKAKVRPLSDAELQSTAVGEIKEGDLMVDFNPALLRDPVRPINDLDELRFDQNLVLPNGQIEKSWDFVIIALRPNYAGSLCVKLRGHIRRKQIQTGGGSSPMTAPF